MDVSYDAYECRIKCAGRQKRLKSSDAKSNFGRDFQSFNYDRALPF